jgi:hypothetical protein
MIISYILNAKMWQDDGGLQVPVELRTCCNYKSKSEIEMHHMLSSDVLQALITARPFGRRLLIVDLWIVCPA